ncbi:hypothetical protein SLEP1_g48429 [Rubroshorea leprosula]|uniref:Uncharacterized protein n=1 Tax=Rubroshorea leprosula TaxID=152421 RepID=A0AAV5LWL1_9ROSI|nr:hypothetical protein SLEP1_g48429 [Rubroshorea leprosula]
MEQLTQPEVARLKSLEDTLKSWEDALKSSKDAGSLSTEATKEPVKPLIKRVTHLLRDKEDYFHRYFKPISVAFGPLHHYDRPELQRGEDNKLQMAARFIKDSGIEKEVFYRNVKDKIDVLMECYDDKQTGQRPKEDLAWMFLVDGCAVLFFIDHDANDNLEALEVKDDVLAYVKLDLFLLENQLPYQLLQILMDCCDGVPCDTLAENQSRAKELHASISTFINKNAMSPVEQEQMMHREKLSVPQHQQKAAAATTVTTTTAISIDTPREPAHLLELLWRRLTKLETGKESDGTIIKLLKKLSPTCNEGICSKGTRKPHGRTRHYRHTFRNVKELKEKGIWLKVSKTSSIRDISLEKRFGMATLRLPPITVDDYTGRKLMNLIAYEMCPDFDNKFEITSYVSFLDSLIDQAEDVKELRDAGVLHNGLGSDKAVALLFNEINKYLVPNPKLHSNLKQSIQAHCNTAFAKYVAQLYHTYFRSPWSFLALVGALLGLALTAVQTYEDIEQSPIHQVHFHP